MITIVLFSWISANNIVASEESISYTVVIDAGSSGSRVYLYEIFPSVDNIFPRVRERCSSDGRNLILKIEPGLSAFIDDPQV